MNRADWEEIQALFFAAQERPREQWAAFLREQRGGEDAVVREVLRMLEHAETPSLDPVGSPSTPPPRSAPVPEGQLGPFDLLEELGRGGMGVVFRARHREEDRIVALKVLPLVATASPEQQERFRREGRLLEKIRHPNVLRVHSVGAAGDAHFIEMDLLPRGDLAQELRRQRGERPGTPRLELGRGGARFATAARLTAGVARGLHAAHELGIVHRDIKPSNLLLSDAGSLQLCDFGLARETSAQTITQSSALLGTPHYMSPEQARRARVQVDHRTDVYSLGVVLYELLTGRRPFDGQTNLEVLSQVVSRTAKPPRQLDKRIPVDLAAICQRAMEKEPERRYPSAQAFAEDLQRFLDHESPEAKPPGLARRLRDGLRPYRTHALVAGLLLATVAVTRQVQAHGERSRWESRLDSIEIPVVERLVAGDDLEPFVLSLEAADDELDRLAADLGDQHRAASARHSQRTREWQEAARIVLATLCGALPQAALDEALATRREDPAFQLPAAELLGLLGRMEALLPEEHETYRDAIATALFPRITIQREAASPGAAERSATARPLDAYFGTPLDAAAIQLGSLPVLGTGLEPGAYRVVVRDADERFGETTVTLLAPGDQVDLSPLTLHAEGDVLSRRQLPERITDRADGMVLVPGGSFRVGRDVPDNYLRRGAEPWPDAILVPSLYVDRYEVTNHEYRLFLLATGHRAPLRWPADWSADWSQWEENDWDLLPVTGIALSDAEAYAAWAGKRLPTFGEWQRIARGLEGWAHPWGDDALAPEAEVHIGTEFSLDLPRPTDRWEHYLTQTAAVGSHPDDRTPEGVFDLQGNVREWTASLPEQELPDGDWMYSPASRITAGRSYENLLGPLHSGFTTPAAVRSFELGFRCVRTAAP